MARVSNRKYIANWSARRDIGAFGLLRLLDEPDDPTGAQVLSAASCVAKRSNAAPRLVAPLITVSLATCQAEQGFACQGRLVENCAARTRRRRRPARHRLGGPAAGRPAQSRRSRRSRVAHRRSEVRTAARGARSAVISCRARRAATLSRNCPPAYIRPTTFPASGTPNASAALMDSAATMSNPDLPMAQRDDDFESEHCKGSHRADGPRRPCELTVPRRAGDPAGNQRSADRQQQHNVGQPLDSGGDPGRPLQ